VRCRSGLFEPVELGRRIKLVREVFIPFFDGVGGFSFGFAVDQSCECFDGVIVERDTLFVRGELLRDGKGVYFSLYGVTLAPRGWEGKIGRSRYCGSVRGNKDLFVVVTRGRIALVVLNDEPLLCGPGGEDKRCSRLGGLMMVCLYGGS
jgi:hypothetical protein